MSGRITEIADGLYHIYEALGVYCTLIVGREKALLVNTGYDFGKLPALVKRVTSLPLQVINTHGHIKAIPSKTISGMELAPLMFLRKMHG